MAFFSFQISIFSVSNGKFRNLERKRVKKNRTDSHTDFKVLGLN